MTNEPIHDSTTSNVLALSPPGAHMQHAPDDEAVAEVDEPPEDMQPPTLSMGAFQRTVVRKAGEHHQSLLTRALHQSDEEDAGLVISTSPARRRSMNSNVSLASTAELTSDTGLTSPARTNTPSPPPHVFCLTRLNASLNDSKQQPAVVGSGDQDLTRSQVVTIAPAPEAKPKDPVVEVLARKRCISFACGAKPEAKKPAAPQQASQTSQPNTTPVVKEPPRKTCIKFACTAKPNPRASTPPAAKEAPAPSPLLLTVPTADQDGRPSTARKHRSPSSGPRGSRRSLTPRRPSRSPVAVRSKKFLSANVTDLRSEGSRFHAFATDEPQEEDWIRRHDSMTSRLTINDTLQKENEIRRLGKEAEEEALQEEEEDDGEEEDEEEEDGDEQDELETPGDELGENGIYGEVAGDDYSGYGSDNDSSDGYNTDNEIGFAESEDEDDGALELWTPRRAPLQASGDTPVFRRSTPTAEGSDSSTSDDAGNGRRRSRQDRSRRIKIRPGTPELPDSTDFVCGTLDEDRPLEDAYISCIAARRREKLRLIPQDIDPSFPTSEPEDEDLDQPKPAHDSDDNLWIPGRLEDIHHEQDQGERRKGRTGVHSPRRYHSPPPKRHVSPPPKARGRSPRRLFDRHSPKRMMSPQPAPQPIRSPPASLVQDLVGRRPVEFKTLAFRPGLTHTKSLPKAPALFPCHLKNNRRGKAAASGTGRHVRGAIDIVKGLEQKRQRRREKFMQKHCNRARKGHVHEKRPQPGQGAERMRELGLLMAGKLGPNPYVLSV